MIENFGDGGTVITGPDILTYRVMTVRRALILKIDTGMSMTRVSALSVAQRDGITAKRTNRGALKDVNRWLGEKGVAPAWSVTYPKG